jgi:hypothetical protein
MCGNILFGQAQQAKPLMKFDSKLHDFGTFKEETGEVSYTFEFTNVGKQPVIIKNVSSNCGCTSPKWSKQPIAPGKKGFIKAFYDPKNRPGAFHKTVTITANTDPVQTKLRIKGKVTPREKTIADLYPRKQMELRFTNNHVAITKVKNTATKEASIGVYNEGETIVEIGFKRMPGHLQVKMVPEKLAPKQKGKIIVTYDASKKPDWGYVKDPLELLINGKHVSGQRLYVAATIVEDFNTMSDEEKAKAPKLEFSEKVFSFGEITQGEKKEHIFKLKNTGKSNLIIRKTHAGCGCTAIAPNKRIVKAGEEAEIKVVFNSRGRRGRQNKFITIITNDPNNSSVRLRISANVTLPKKV